MKKQKILLFANTDWYLYNFRKALATKYRDNGFEVVLISPSGIYGPKLRDEGFKWVPFDFSTKSINPFREVLVLYKLFQLYKAEKPAICHHFTIKCSLYGTLVSRVLGNIKVVNSITGLGHVFTDKGFRVTIVRQIVKLLYKCIFAHRNIKVIFQNEEDQNKFIQYGLIKRESTTVIRGSGVDCKQFTPSQSTSNNEKIILFASRMLREKGVFELVNAANILKQKHINAKFVFAGDLYPENPSSLTQSDIESIIASGLVEYRGHVHDMTKLIQESDIVVLPSYSEGTPKILLEAAAAGKPIVTTDIAGCRGVVQHGKNGFLVPVGDSEALSDALISLCNNNNLMHEFGKAGRVNALLNFDVEIINEKTINVLRELNLSCASLK